MGVRCGAVRQLEMNNGKVVVMMESAVCLQNNPKPWSLYGLHTPRARRTSHETRARTNLGIDRYKGLTLRHPQRPRAGLVKTRCLTIRPSSDPIEWSDRAVGLSNTKARDYPSLYVTRTAQIILTN